jgi:hypothetical protein
MQGRPISENNSNELSYNRIEEESFQINDIIQNAFPQFDLPNEFASVKSLGEPEERLQANLHIGIPNSALSSRRPEEQDAEEEKCENYSRNTFKPAFQKLSDPNITKIFVPPPSKDMENTKAQKISHRKKCENPHVLHKESNTHHSAAKEEKSTKQQYKCDICNKVLKKKHSLKSHMRKHVLSC